MKIDIFNHVMPQAYLELVKQHSKEPGMVKRMSSLRMLWDIEHRVEMLRTKFPDVQQVLTLGLPSPSSSAGPTSRRSSRASPTTAWPRCAAVAGGIPGLRRLAADEQRRRTRSRRWTARSTSSARKGIQIVSSVAGRPLDDPEFFPVFERIDQPPRPADLDAPRAPGARADYAGEPKSKYEIWQVLGWPFETSVAMARIVFSGLLQRLPKLRIITHHCGGMIPYFAGRAETLWAQLGCRSADDEEAAQELSKPPIEYFKMFYGDTVLGGAARRSPAASRSSAPTTWCSRATARSIPKAGRCSSARASRSIEALNLPEGDKRKIYFGNALRLLRMEGKLTAPR